MMYPFWSKASLVPSAARGRRNPRAADVSRSAVDVDERVVERPLEQIVEACCAHARVDGDVGLDAAGVQHEPGLAAPALVVGTPAALRVVRAEIPCDRRIQAEVARLHLRQEV